MKNEEEPAGGETNTHDDVNKTKTNVGGQSTGGLPPHHPTKIGCYKLIRVIASGGMGTVFEGLQDNPRRSVAIKVIKGGDVSNKAVSRLKYEAQMLARLRHPGIAEIYEAGTYDDNGAEVPYFAMEYIPNAKTITEYAKQRNLSLNQRLELFLQVCDAVNSGHQKGIVHRDLKPDNILVDSHNRVRIIDFGLARATDSDVRHTRAHTEVGQIVGSLHYMSPEQFETDSSDLDIRSDVYSLGVVLYELLSGSLPYDLSSKQVYEVASIVRESKPLPINKTGRRFPSEIDVILQKCLSKERHMRYQTAYGLHQDIGRYLAGDAIVAKSPSLTYQIKVFARKNKLLVGAFATAVVILVAGVVVSTTLLVRVSTERERALAESEKAKKARSFLTSIFDKAVPLGFGKPVPISRLLDESAKMLEGQFPDDPEVESDIRHAFGLGYYWCEENKKARESLEHALRLRRETLGESHPKTRSTLEALNDLYTVTGDFPDYLTNCQELCRLDSLQHGPTQETTLSSKLSVVAGLERMGRISDATELAEKVRESCLNEHADNPELLCETDWNLSWLLLQSGRIEESEELARECFQRASSKIGEGWSVSRSKSCLAAALIAGGKLDEAAQLYSNFPTYPELDREFDIQGNFNPGESRMQFIIFWEEWCPYCDRMMQKVERLNRKYRRNGIDFIGVTQLWSGSTLEDSKEFIEEHDITFPIIKAGGRAFDHFNCGGVPAIRLVYNGTLIWEEYLPSDEPVSGYMLEGMVTALKSS